MKITTRDAWIDAVERKGSTLCAGIDPAEYVMGRTEKGEGLPEGVNKRDWVLRYIEAVAPYVAAVKPNIRFFGRGGDLEILEEIAQSAHAMGLLAIQDSKEADIGSTNDAGIFYAARRGMDAVTLSTFAGNTQEAAKQGADRGIGLISMCLMSNPEYERVKRTWVDISDDKENYQPQHIVEINGVPHAQHYMQLARDANRFGLAGIVIGAPSAKNHLKEEEIRNASYYFAKGQLILVPGIGAQGGEITMLSKYFNFNLLIANVGRGLMFPYGATSTPEDQAAAAKQYKNRMTSSPP